MNEHINHQIPDYVLNLLPKMERPTVEQHTAVCGHCQTALQAEREMGQMVRLTLHTVTQPANGRLAHLMPAIPTPKQRWSFTMMGWQRQLAVVTMLVMILMGSFGVWNGRSQNIWGVPSPTTQAATATTNATATIAQQQTTQAEETLAAEGLTTTAVASPAVQPAQQTTAQASIISTPPPPPTPIAALSINMATN